MHRSVGRPLHDREAVALCEFRRRECGRERESVYLVMRDYAGSAVLVGCWDVLGGLEHGVVVSTYSWSGACVVGGCEVRLAYAWSC